jgi:hypothetical protein
MAGCVGPVERHSGGVNFHDLQDSTPNPYEGCQGVSLSWWVCGFGGELGFFGTYPLRVRTELFSG